MLGVPVEPHRPLWHKRFRYAAFAAVAVAAVWTVVIILPFDPFNSLLPVMIGGGAGTWLLLGYVIYLAVGVGGLAALASLLSTVELGEGKTPNAPVMIIGLVLLFVGVTASCLLLGIAGATGGYAQTIQHQPEASLESILTPFVDITRVTSAVAVLGAAAVIFGIGTARGEIRSE